MKKLFPIIITILLFACTQNKAIQRENDWTVFNGQSIPYQIQLPKELHQYVGAGGRAFDTNPTNNDPEEGDYTVDIYDSKKDLSCSPQNMGMYQEDLIQRNDGMVWGKVSRDATRPNGIQMSICNYPPEGRCALWDDKKPDCTAPKGGAYSLCGEHNGKTVLVCISQVKDDPEMAEKIFNSFRWTK